MFEYFLDFAEKRKFVFFWLGDEDIVEEYSIILHGDQSEVDVYGIFYGCGTRRYSNSVTIVHQGKATRANVFACGVALDRSFIDFSGILRVERGAVQTRTFFRAHFMILDRYAGVRTFPGLEIQENAILQGGHAAVIGKVHEEQMFYLMSRGLDFSKARKIILRGFFEPVLTQLDSSYNAIRSRLYRLL